MSREPESAGAGPRRLRFDLGEASGALGDLGTFIPLTVALITVCGLDAGTVLLFAGLFNVLVGLWFNQPIPVQPMKAIAAIAVAEGLAPGAVVAGGIGVGAVLLLAAVTGLIGRLDRWVPRSVVRGIQLGVGLKLLLKGLEMVGGLPALAPDGQLTALVAAVVVLAALGRKRFPSALVLFVGGFGLMALAAPQLPGLELGWRGPHLLLPTAAEWRTGLLRGALPQLPLTLLNSVIAVAALSEDLFPGRGVGPRSMAVTVGLMNLVGGWLGAMPVCNGAGGLAGQHGFGARTGGSVVLLGATKIALALVLGSSAGLLLAAYPASILGVLLGFAGLELAGSARACEGRRAFLVALLTAGCVLGLGTAQGFLIGLAAALLVEKLGAGD